MIFASVTFPDGAKRRRDSHCSVNAHMRLVQARRSDRFADVNVGSHFAIRQANGVAWKDRMLTRIQTRRTSRLLSAQRESHPKYGSKGEYQTHLLLQAQERHASQFFHALAQASVGRGSRQVDSTATRTASGARSMRCGRSRRARCTSASSPARGLPSPSWQSRSRGRRGGGDGSQPEWGARSPGAPIQ